MDRTEVAALQALYTAAKPTHIPGAWIRDAILRIMEESTKGGRADRMGRTDYTEWCLEALLDHLCELATQAREELFSYERISDDTGRRILAVRTEIQTRARTVQFLVGAPA